jgi:hypothetical protein
MRVSASLTHLRPLLPATAIASSMKVGPVHIRNYLEAVIALRAIFIRGHTLKEQAKQRRLTIERDNKITKSILIVAVH